ncbi:histone-binding N1 N2-like isoform X1, partial [Paramuricea clavata]
LESGVLGSAIKEAVEEESPDYDEDTSMETEGQGGTSAGASAESSSNNKLPTIVKTTTEDNTAGQAKPSEETVAKGSAEKAEGCTEEKMEEDGTESKTDDDKKESVEGEEKAGTSEEKPAGERAVEKMVEDTTEESKVEDKSSDDNKDKTEEEQQGNDNKDVSEDTNKGDKESTSEENKEVDDAVGENEDQKEPEGQKEDVEDGENKTTGEQKEDVKDGENKTTGEQKEGVEDGENKTTGEQKEGVEDGENKTTGEQKEGVEDGENKTTGEQKDDVDKDNKDEDVNVDEDVNDEQTTDDGPVSTIQLAWETLELARIIFKRHSNTEMQLKLAQTHLLLGEIHMEQEQFSDAVSELTKCLNIQKNLLKSDDRLLAETYYNLGLAYTLSMLYEESASHYGNATEVLELRLKNIKTRIEEAEQQDKGKGKASDDDPLVKDRKELAELEDLLPEVKEKCLDAKNENERLKSNIKEKLGLTSAGFESSSLSTCSTSCSDKPATDIGHLVRKKRKPKDDENTENIEAPAKKPRQEGESTTTQPENGNSTMAKANGDEPQS